VSAAPKLSARNVTVSHGARPAIRGVSLDIVLEDVTALIGAAGSGKTVFLRTLNRLNGAGAHVTGTVRIDGQDIHAPEMDVVQLRARVGLVFQTPNPFPRSVYENVAYGPRLHGLAENRRELDQIIEQSLRRAALWDEVKDRLADPGTALTPGQQQRLCIARALAVDPEVLLMDEPCSALDPAATARIEELIHDLRGRHAIAIVTRNLQLAARVSQKTAFLHLGELVEFGETADLLTNPRADRTRDFITGRFG
jgi:phosphate transport system ATP-binding protein